MQTTPSRPAKQTQWMLAILLTGILFQLGLQARFRKYALEGIYFFPLYPSSETMMHTVSIIDLRDAPVETLWNIHIQPPALDFIRAVLVQFWIHIGPEKYDGDKNSLSLLHQVDGSLYLVWAFLYGSLASLIYRWLSQTINHISALVGTLVFMLHPANIFYATLLDGTFLSSVLITFLFYYLWKVKQNPETTVAPLIFITLGLFFTRSIFQWQSIFLLTVCLFLLNMPTKKIVIFTTICGVVAFGYLGKQYAQFGIFSTTSFTGYNLTKSVDMRASQSFWSETPGSTAGQNLPTTLTRDRKLNGERNFNNIFYLELNQRLMEKFSKAIRTIDARKLALNYLDNLGQYFRPSSGYGPHVIVDRLPWRGVYDAIFSSPILSGLLFTFGLHWVLTAPKTDYRNAAAYLLPAAYIFFACVLLEKGENTRFKFFLEPVIFIFLMTVGDAFWKNISSKLIEKKPITK